MKKLREMPISGIIARSWKTVAIPRSMASRGESKRTSSPSSAMAPLVGWWTPEKILIRVDFPAPLSPSRHVTCPALTSMEMSSRATTCPKYFETPLASMRGASFAIIVPPMLAYG
jgi:hypothetical protein